MILNILWSFPKVLSDVAEIVQRNIFVYEGEYVRDLARRSIGRFEKTTEIQQSYHSYN